MNQDAEKNKGFAVLAYLSWLLLIPLFCAKDSHFAKFHVGQGINLAIFWTAWWVIEVILGIALGWIWIVGPIITVLAALPNLFFCVIAIIGIVNAVNGEEKPLPIFGKFQIIKL
ncbi:MAG: hypothetical protein K6F44_04585 [Lachnospiraceae bacterium]|nr:hypothetical protein [Lachnospiraceae bacterium]